MRDHLYSVLLMGLNVILTHEPTICCRHGVYLPVYELVFDQITKPQFVELEYTVRTLVFGLSTTCEYSACIFREAGVWTFPRDNHLL